MRNIPTSKAIQAETFGRWLDRNLNDGRTNREVARKANIDPSYLTHMVQGNYAPSARIVEQIADALGRPRTEALVWAGYLPPLDDETRQRVLDALS